MSLWGQLTGKWQETCTVPEDIGPVPGRGGGLDFVT